MSSPTTTSLTRRHIQLLVYLSLSSRVFVYILAFLTSRLPLFDVSPAIVQTSKLTQPLLRWDAFHFVHIAEKGYVYEHEWAFFPGVPTVMRYLSSIFNSSDVLLAGGLAAMACDTSIILYHLTLHHLGHPQIAFLATLLSLINSSPATLRLASYAEPFFTYLSYRGMLFCAQSRWFLASLCFMLAGAFRSNGILLSGFILWGLLMQPFFEAGKVHLSAVLRSTLFSAMIFAPLIYHQVTGYMAFCLDSQPAKWCSNTLPLIYSHVQSEYWHVGFLRYWTLQQLPNFVIAAPPLITIIAFSFHVLRAAFATHPTFIEKDVHSQSPFSAHSLVPHAIHALGLSCTVLFASHVQIILRLAASMPLTYWAAAWLVSEHPTAGKWWVGWSLVWGTVSIVLWGAFLPPA